MASVPPLQNFGRNLLIQPAAYYEPADEGEVLALLDRHRGEQIRVIGSLHSWSEAANAEGVLLNLRTLQQFQLTQEGHSAWVGAGCQIKVLLERLQKVGRTLPSIGLITEQTIAGAISTGTHGSGRSSLSHYVDAVRVARYHAVTGAAVIEEIDGGDELRAARCSLGCLGVIVSVKIQCRDRYAIEEHFQEYKTLDAVLSAEQQYPLQQFFLAPWRWTYLAQHRREVPEPRRSSLAWVYRVYWFLSIDLGLHLLILFALRAVGSWWFIQFLYRHVISNTVIRNWKVIDNSSAMLVMEHELFRHIEIELFVTRDQLPAALEYLKQSLIFASGSAPVTPPEVRAEGSHTPERPAALRGRYCHHYPICIRRVLADDTLISMSSGTAQDRYAISLISYARPAERQGFQDVAAWLATTMSGKFAARPHWGKYCPLSPAELVALYPRFREFRAICQNRDPQAIFQNKWIRRLFEMP